VVKDAPQPAVQAARTVVTEYPKLAAVPPPARPKEPVMSEPAVVVRGLRKSFGTKEAVAGIDLEIAPGSLAGLVGPNGAGKTTSLSMMTGLLRPDGGQILINGIDVWKDSPRAAKAVMGVVPDQARLFERLSGAEMLEYAGRLRGMPADEARSRATQLLDVLDLTADSKRLVADYSTGMRKKTMLGCALIHNPAVLFLDEPLEGVDPVSADSIRRLLTRFTATGSTVLFSSHVMELVEQICDHVSVINHGQIVASGTTAQVRGGKTLQQAFIDLVGPHASDEEGLPWLGTSSS
jgi:ABC-2 type transport system ATP-binding protein